MMWQNGYEHLIGIWNLKINVKQCEEKFST